jgi:hypothetical protein
MTVHPAGCFQRPIVLINKSACGQNGAELEQAEKTPVTRRRFWPSGVPDYLSHHTANSANRHGIASSVPRNDKDIK